MKKRILLLSAVLSLTVLLGGCSLLPFAEDNPFEKQEVKRKRLLKTKNRRHSPQPQLRRRPLRRRNPRKNRSRQRSRRYLTRRHIWQPSMIMREPSGF